MLVRSGLVAVLLVAACSSGDAPADLSSPSTDLMSIVIVDPTFDLGTDPADLSCEDDPCACSPYCHRVCIGPPNAPFPLQGDAQPVANERETGVARDPNGYLGLDSTHVSFNWDWSVNSTDWGRGTVSKINSKTLREAARYFTVTCSSLKGGSKQVCDGMTGCCAADDAPRFAARQAKQPEPGHQQVQLMDNRPSRSSVDFNGDLVVANRAPGGQPSVTRISNAACIDRNRDGKIQTSNDANGDGLIETDCNGDGLPDDLDGVKALPCRNNGKEEFFGLDDECVLWTTNVDMVGGEARGLSLGEGAIDSGVSDPWVVTTPSASAARIGGATGLIKEIHALPAGCQPLGMAMDATGIAWMVSDGAEPVCWLDTHSGTTGLVRAPGFTLISPYGIGMDRDQNVWISGGTNTPEAYRYTPDRSQKLANLGQGYWTEITQLGKAGGATGHGRGLGADSRTPNSYWVWMAVDGGYVVQIPGSQIIKPAKMDQQIDGSQYPVISLPGTTPIAASPDYDQNIAVASRGPSQWIRIFVDRMGVVKPPDLNSAPAPMMRCPAGDRCALKDDPNSEPGIDNYSDFCGFPSRIDSRPVGTYSYIFKGECAPTTFFSSWNALEWDADVPPNTSLSVIAKAGPFATFSDMGWYTVNWTDPANASPLSLVDLPPANPGDPTNYLQTEFTLKALDFKATPKLKSICVTYSCADTN